VDGEGVYLVDSEGKRYLDFVSGIAVNALGYGDAGLRQAMHAAADGLIHVSNLYATLPGQALANTLAERSFADKVFFCYSGAEANEGAFKFARRWARTIGPAKHEIIALRGAFHGRLFGTLAATDRPSYRAVPPARGGHRDCRARSRGHRARARSGDRRRADRGAGAGRRRCTRWTSGLLVSFAR
jgi:acetylornithine/succinyldiaminopimelate/putrescine aminotransferase